MSVGNDARERMADAWARARDGARTTVLIRGGAAATRLAHATEDLADGALVIELRGDDEVKYTPFRPVITAVARLLSGPTTSTAIAATLRLVEIPEQPTTSLLALLLGIPVPVDGPDLAAMSAWRRRRSTVDVTLALLDALAVQRPLLVVVSDVDDVDPSTIELLSRWLARGARGGVLLVATTRNAAGGWLRADETLSLGGGGEEPGDSTVRETMSREPERLARRHADAGRVGQAIASWQEAGLSALHEAAYDEAFGCFGEALSLLESVAESSARDAAELALRGLWAVAFALAKGWGAPEVDVAFRRVEALSAVVGDDPSVFPMRTALTTFSLLRGDLARARRQAVAVLAAAKASGDADAILEAEHDACVTAFHGGDHDACVAHAARVAELHDPEGHLHHVYLYGRNPGASAALHRSLAEQHLGRADEAVARVLGVIADLERAPHPFSLAWAWTTLAELGRREGDHAATIEASDRALAIAAEEGITSAGAYAAVLRGAERVRAGDDGGKSQIEAGVAAWAAMGIGLPIHL
jgi:tetratricopeptide (TPR) repeat protein